MTRALKPLLDEGYRIQGHDGSAWGEQVMECEREYQNIHHTDMIIPVPDPLVKKHATHDHTFLPSLEEIELCQDKAKTAEVLGDLAPKTFWVRDTHGAGGAGAQMASEYLPGRNYSVELLYNKGELLGYFMKERLAYDLKGSKEPTHQRGSSAVSVCIRNDSLLDRARMAVAKISTRPHGVYSIDFKENEAGEPKITEINPGRFLTASYVYYYSTGYNLPMAMVKAYFGEPYELGAYPEGVGCIRQVDSLPWVGELPERYTS